jgi:hypothetical protein
MGRTVMSRVVANAVIVAGVLAAPAGALERHVIGVSREGRDIVAVRVGTPTGTPVLVVGCIHGNECAGRAIVKDLIRARIVADLWLVPTLNPDGTRRRTRQNGAGVDLNRNWASRWKRQGEPWSLYYSGPRVFSEPESRAGRGLITRVRPRVSIWYHQHMNVVWAVGSAADEGRIYAARVGMGVRTDDSLRGTAVGWQQRRFPTAGAFVVELPAGPVPATARVRHVEAVRRLVQMRSSKH